MNRDSLGILLLYNCVVIVLFSTLVPFTRTAEPNFKTLSETRPVTPLSAVMNYSDLGAETDLDLGPSLLEVVGFAVALLFPYLAGFPLIGLAAIRRYGRRGWIERAILLWPAAMLIHALGVLTVVLLQVHSPYAGKYVALGALSGGAVLTLFFYVLGFVQLRRGNRAAGLKLAAAATAASAVAWFLILLLTPTFGGAGGGGATWEGYVPFGPLLCLAALLLGAAGIALIPLAQSYLPPAEEEHGGNDHPEDPDSVGADRQDQGVAGI